MKVELPIRKPLGRPRLQIGGLPRGRALLLLAAAALLFVAGYLVNQRFLSPSQVVTAPQTVPVRKGSLVSSVTATGSVVAARQAKLSFGASGRLSELNVAVGDSVKAGQQLARLDDQAQRVKVAQAESSLKTSQIKLEQLKEGATAEEIAAARAAYEAALAKYREISAGPTQSDLETAQAAVDQATTALAAAEAKLADLKKGPTAEDLTIAQTAVDQARSNLASAQAKLDELKAGPTTAELAAAQASVNSARQALLTAEDKYEMAKGDNLKESGFSSVSAAQQNFESARANYEAAVQKLEELKAGPTAAELQSAQSAVDSARASLASAEAKLAQIKAGPKEADLLSAQSAVDSARNNLATAVAKLNDLKAGPKESDLQSARSSLASAESQLALKTSGPKAAELALAEEQVRQAEIALQQARLELSNTVLVAPFDGVVSAVSANLGEQVSGAAITLVDPRSARIDVTVDENDVAKVAAGQSAVITFDALPDRRLRGKVLAVAPAGTSQQGVVSYQVSIGMESANTLPAGMSATATIETERKDDVLLVPNRALRTQGRERVVEVLVGERTELRTVQVGASNDQFTEIVSGLQEGELVVIPTTTTVPPRTGFGPGAPAGPQPAMKVVR